MMRLVPVVGRNLLNVRCKIILYVIKDIKVQIWGNQDLEVVVFDQRKFQTIL